MYVWSWGKDMLLKCPECGALVLDRLQKCSECGCPIEYILDRNHLSKYSAISPVNVLEAGMKSGNAEATYWLAYCTYFGENGVPQNTTRAKQLLVAASKLGNKMAKLDFQKWFGTSLNDGDNKDIASSSDKQLSDLFSKFKSIVIFDLETSGLNPELNRIIEFAAIKVSQVGGQATVINELNEMVRLPNGVQLSQQIKEITGISNDILERAGKEEQTVCADFLRFLENENPLMVSYNAQFDMGFLASFLKRNNLYNVFERFHTIDALTVYKDRRDYPHKLKDAIAAYNLGDCVRNSHRAIDDTYSLLEVLKAMDNESQDLDRYIDLFGFNPKYGINGKQLPNIRYVAQPYNSSTKLYEKVG